MQYRNATGGENKYFARRPVHGLNITVVSKLWHECRMYVQRWQRHVLGDRCLIKQDRKGIYSATDCGGWKLELKRNHRLLLIFQKKNIEPA